MVSVVLSLVAGVLPISALETATDLNVKHTELAASISPSNGAGLFSPQDLRVGDGFREPLGLHDSTPSFSWDLPAGARAQSAYRVVVATRPELLPDNADPSDIRPRDGDGFECETYRASGKYLSIQRRWPILATGSSGGRWVPGTARLA